MPLALDDFTVTLDGALQTSSTTIAAAGADVIVVATTLRDQGLHLTSCYLGGLDGPLAATHLLQTRGHDRFDHELLEPLAGSTHARRCLLHHAGELQAALAGTGADARVEVAPRALAAADRVWEPHDP